MLNKEDILDIGTKYIDENELYGFVNKICFKKNFWNTSDGYYDYYKKIIVINYNNDYIESLITLFHELTHAKQFKILKTSKSLIRELYVKCIELQLTNHKTYILYHDLFPTEHNAICNSNILTMEYLDYDDNTKMKIIANSLISDYKLIQDSIILSPIERMKNNIILNKDYIDELSIKLNNLDKLFNCLPIDKEIYKELEAIVNNKKTVLDYKQYIKSIN